MESSHISLVPHDQHPAPEVQMLQVMNLHGHVRLIPSPWFILELPLGAVHTMVLEKCIVTCIYLGNFLQIIFLFFPHFFIGAMQLYILMGFVQSVFHFPKNPMASACPSLFAPLILVSMVFPFPEYHIIGIAWPVAFSE